MGAQRIARTLPETYFALVRQFPLTHIQDEMHLELARRKLDELLQQDLDEGNEAYLEALTDLVGVYEDEHEPIPDAPRAKPVIVPSTHVKVRTEQL